jgi:2-methylcitrate dehydratase PrpD
MSTESKLDSSRTIVYQLARFVDRIDLKTTPPAVIDEARRCVLDTLGVIIAGQHSPVAQAALRHALQSFAPGEASLPGLQHRVSALAAALVNGTAAHALDFDDTSYTGIMHGSAVVLPAALAMAQSHSADGEKLLEAFIAGVEVEYAIAELCTTHIYFKGWWTSGVFGPMGAAAAAAKLLDLELDQIVHALALAMCNTSGSRASFGTDAKPLGIGLAASHGLESALLAAAGLSAPTDIFENSNGFSALYNDGQHAREYDMQLSARWRLTDPGILFKSYPVCSAAQAAAELCQDMVRQNRLDPEQIVSVSCEVPQLVAISLIYAEPKSIRQAQFSMPFAIGSMLAFDELSLDQLKPEVLASNELQRQMKKVTMQVPQWLRDDASVADRCPEGAGIKMTTRLGEQYDAFLERPTGMPGNPVSDESLTAKFHDCCRFGGILDSQSMRIAERIWQLESIDNLATLID